MKSVIIRLIAGLLLLVIGAVIFLNTFDIYPFKGYHVYKCSLCEYEWQVLQPLSTDPKERVSCPNFGTRLYTYTCQECSHQWQSYEELNKDEAHECPSCEKEGLLKISSTLENKCAKKLRTEGAELKKNEGHYLYVGNITNRLIENTVGGVLGVAGFGLLAFTGYRYFMNKPSKKSEDD